MSSNPGFWRKCRFAFRCCRFTAWALVLLLLAAFGWLHEEGLPDFLKSRLVAALHERGVQLEFTRMRLSLVSGILCDNVRIGEARQGGAALTAREIELRLDYPALLHRRLQVDGLVLRRGKITYLLSDGDSLSLTNLESELRFENGDIWSLDQFKADFAGASFTLGGEVAHAPEFQKWKMFAGAKSADRGSMESSLKSLSDTLKQIHFRGKPRLNARLSGDARDVHSFTFSLNASAPAVETPWFSARDLECAAQAAISADAPAYNDPAWGFWTNLQPFQIEWKARGVDLKVEQLTADTVDCAGTWDAPGLAVTNLSARLGGGALNSTATLDVASRRVSFKFNSSCDPRALAMLLTGKIREHLSEISWTKPPRLAAAGSLVLADWTNRAPDWRRDVGPTVRLHGDLAFENAVVAGVARVDSARTHFDYANLIWTLPDLHLTQGHTWLDVAGEENEADKSFRCMAGGKLDVASVRPFLTSSNAVQGFEHLSFREPVAIALDATGNLENFSSLSATGRLTATDFAIRGQRVESLSSALTYTNLTVEFLGPQLSRAKGTQTFTAEKATLDIAGQKLYLRHGRGRVSPYAVAEAIGPKTAEAMDPYQFLTLPEATVNGCIPLKFEGENLVPDEADLRFDLLGSAPFRWLKFETPGITGTIHWLGRYLILTNVTAQCYGGTAHGSGVFNLLTPGPGTDFSFFMEGTNVDFNAMGRALWSPTNQLRGLLSGAVTVTSANSDDWRTWNGYGHARLRNGVLWNAPVFGLVSRALNTLTPGLDMGNSRATEGSGSFTMVNGVIFTDTLEIRSMTMRVQYNGTVDLQQNVSARARAQLLRNTPMVGQLFSVVLWPVSKAFECQVTGTLDRPKITPLYIPFANYLAAPLHPVRSFEEFFAPVPTNDSGAARP